MDVLKKTAITDVETVLLSTSIAFRSGNAAPTAHKEDVMKSIKETRAKFIEQNTYKPSINKVTSG